MGEISTKYKKIIGVKGVRIIFITEQNTDYRKAEKIAEKNCVIAETLNHMMNIIFGVIL